jgi:hypothetical protein
VCTALSVKFVASSSSKVRAHDELMLKSRSDGYEFRVKLYGTTQHSTAPSFNNINHGGEIRAR